MSGGDAEAEHDGDVALLSSASALQSVRLRVGEWDSEATSLATEFGSDLISHE